MLSEPTSLYQEQLVMPATSSNGAVSNGGVNGGETGMMPLHDFLEYLMSKLQIVTMGRSIHIAFHFLCPNVWSNLHSGLS